MPRRALTVSVSGLLFVVAGWYPVFAARPSARDALGLKPVQADVDYQLVAEDQIDRCEVVDLKGQWVGWEVRSADGEVLRRFADTNKNKKVDLWCYFRDGVEVYRDIDSDFNGKADQYRWLGTAGTRWGIDEDENGTIDRWKQISPEEVTAELVAALATKDSQRFERLLLSSDELRALGFADDEAAAIAKRIERARGEFAAFAARQKVVRPQSQWVQFAAAPPGVLPTGTRGLKQDLVVYENAVAMFESEGETGQLVAGTIVQVGPAWRLIDLPQVIEDNMVAQGGGYFFSPAVGSAVPANTKANGEETQRLVAELEKIDQALAKAMPADLSKLNAGRADIVEKLAIAASGAERRAWVQQLVDTVAAAVQEGTYADGLQRLKKIDPRLLKDDKSLQSYLQFQVISAEYAARLRDSKPDDFPKIQEWYLGTLTKFGSLYEGTAEAGLAMMQLALSKEFEADEAAALSWYRQVAKEYPGEAFGAKAAGAVRRLESAGKQLNLQGKTLDGKTFDLSSLRGSPVVIHYWATWCEPCKQDMRRLRQLQAQFQSKGLKVVGISVDGRREDAIGYLRENSLPWVQMFEDGGLEGSRLANELGVQTLPTTLLVDKTGKVVRHNVQVAQLGDELDQLTR